MDSLLDRVKSFLKKVDFDRLENFNKDNDVLLIKFSLHSDSEGYYTSPKEIASFVKILNDQGYKTIVIPKETDFTVENKDSVKKILNLPKKDWRNYNGK